MNSQLAVIGVTGGIGAGKSTVARLLGGLGTLVIDSDRLAHEELQSPTVVAAVRELWGQAVLSPQGEVDRAKLGSVVFHDPRQLQKLEDLLYPKIHQRRRQIIEKHAADPQVRAVVLDAPKLYEAGVDKECDAVIFVDADEKTRLSRVSQTRGWDEAELARREKMQIPLDKKKAMADYVVVNNHPSVDSLTLTLQRILDSVVASKGKQSQKP